MSMKIDLAIEAKAGVRYKTKKLTECTNIEFITLSEAT